ncbi:sensor histidine kinase [Natronolimnobius baerhuensis]|uniref:histidine kinase n=1 Tax=Natronolimnobius baerhuensis TaxID=253108 RepID=A0A202E4S6_9EURY|nr:ATP-binding protein [Natronolimnobius baerhuensis]OVE82910.1 histidine kinase [Natronolimnobius baerhuensis]
MRHWNRLLTALGLFILTIGGVRTGNALLSEGIPLDDVLAGIVIEVILIGLPGLALMFVGLMLPKWSILPVFYSRIIMFAVGGVVVASVVTVLRQLHPAVEIVGITTSTQLILLSVGSVAGLLLGVENAHTLTKAKTLEKKNAELEQKYRLEKQNKELKQTERRLEEAVSELESSNERLEEFAYAVSHDLQEPLRMITSYLQLLEQRYEDDLDDEGEEFIEFAVDGAERMRSMIDGLLDYSRVQTQGDPFDTVDLDDVLDDVLTDLQFRVEESNAEIEREPLPTVEGDRSQLRQVFQNLLTNAIDYSGEDPPRIYISAERDGPAWTISVSDNGIGIDPSDAERIFGIFERLHSIDEHTGSGIGLAVCKRIIERHDGTIWVDSEPGSGSTFSFTLPDAEAVSNDLNHNNETKPTRHTYSNR